MVELGSGAGFFASRVPSLIASDIIRVTNLQLVCDGHKLPFSNASLGAITMVNVLHHLSEPRLFFMEAERCLSNGGTIEMIEPWRTVWSEFVYTKLHHEPFDPTVQNWGFSAGGPLSGANGALPWIMLERDLSRFREEFPDLQIKIIRPIMPFVYLLSGGISLRVSMPAWTYGFWRLVERACQPLLSSLGMFAFIVIQKEA